MCELRCEAVLDNKADMLDNDAATKGQEAGIREAASECANNSSLDY